VISTAKLTGIQECSTVQSTALIREQFEMLQ
jgi:hypothetical protein